MLGDCHIHMILDGVYYRAAIDAQRNHPDEGCIRSRLEAYRSRGIRFLRDGGDAWGVGAFAARIASEYEIDYRTPIFPIYRRGRYGSFIGRGFSNLSEYTALVDEARDSGADFIKIMISGLMDFEHLGVITSQPLEAEEIGEMIAIAHQRHMCVMAHANGSRTVRAAVEAGVDSIEHGAYLDAETIACLARSGAVWVPTLVTVGNLIGDGRYPDGVLRPLLKGQMEAVRSCARLGGKVALGSDNGAYRVPHVQGTLDEAQLLRQALGDGAEAVLADGEREIRKRFRIGGA